MKKRKQIICAIILAACSTSACSGTIYHSRSISGSSIDFVDARQRAIIVHGEPKNGQTGGGGFATCSEPQPDVFTAMAASLGLDVGLAPQSGTDTARVAAAISENAATISRTQTINLLRESFFRTCERYLRGTPSPEMIVQAARDQRVMVSVLAIEQLTGTITPAPTIIRTSSNASLAADAGKVIDALNTARADATSAETKAAADDAAAKALDTSNACPTIRKIDSATRTEDQNTKLGECDTASTKAKASRAAATNALAHYDALRSVAGTASGASAGASGTGDLPSPGTQPTAADRAAVANAVARIVDSTFQFDEFTMLCVRVLSATAQPGEAELRAKCLELMTALVTNEANVQVIRARAAEFSQATNDDFAAVQSFVAPNGVYSKQNLDRLVQRYEAATKPSALSPNFKAATDLPTLQRYFVALSPATQKSLAQFAAQ